MATPTAGPRWACTDHHQSRPKTECRDCWASDCDHPQPWADYGDGTAGCRYCWAERDATGDWWPDGLPLEDTNGDRARWTSRGRTDPEPEPLPLEDADKPPGPLAPYITDALDAVRAPLTPSTVD